MVFLAVTAPVSGCDSEQKKPEAAATSAPAPDAQIVQMTVDGLHFTPSTVSVHPGKVRVVLTTSGQAEHTFTSTALGVNSGNIPAGKSITLDFNVPKPGEYAFYCAYHRSQGMTGMIVAKD